MFYSDEKKLEDFLIENNINPNQFDFLWRLYSPNSGISSVYRLFRELKYPGTNRTMYTNIEDINYLLDKGFIEEDMKGTSKFPDKYKLTKGFFEKFTIKSEGAFEELYNTYPEFLDIKGERFNARSCDFDELSKVYSKKINQSLSKHNKIIEELKNQIDLNLINLKLENWVKGEMWRQDTINKQSIDTNVL